MIKPLEGVHRDIPYRNSFKKYGEHLCILTGKPMPDAAHIRHGFYGAGLKPHDYLIIPLAHELHDLQHRMGEERFWRAHFNKIPDIFIEEAKEKAEDDDVMTLVKQIAKDYYDNYKAR